MEEKLARRLFYIDKLHCKLDAIGREKSDILLTQNTVLDEEYYTDEMDEIFEQIDIALEDAKEKIEDLIEILKEK